MLQGVVVCGGETDVAVGFSCLTAANTLHTHAEVVCSQETNPLWHKAMYILTYARMRCKQQADGMNRAAVQFAST